MPKRYDQTSVFYTDNNGVPTTGKQLINDYRSLSSTTPSLAADEGSKGGISGSGVGGTNKLVIHNTGVFYTDHHGVSPYSAQKKANSDL